MNTILLFCFTVLSFFFAQTSSSFAAHQPFDYESIYIYNFTKYIYFPNTGSKIVIGVVGSPAAAHALRNVAFKKNNESLQYEVKYFQTVAHISDCNILFVTPEYNEFLPIIKQKLRNKTTLLITEANPESSPVNLFWNREHTRLEFAINKEEIEKLGLKVSTKLLGMAKKS